MEGSRLGPYRLLSELGSGGMGTVYLAEDEAAAQVAVKVVHPHLLATPGFFKRFLREADLGRKVVHENVVRTFDIDATDLDGKVVHYMAMEYVEGKNLRQLLDDLGTIPETLLREIALQVAAGLCAIHEAGVIHRDLKPENVLITSGHEIRIMDLGVAKLQEASIAITEEGQFAGSLPYAAPEQFGSGEVRAAADLYSLGVMLYELATGDNPFRRNDVVGTIHAHLEHEPPRLTDLKTETSVLLAELVAKLLAKEPANRFASAEELRAVLEEAERSQWWTELAPRLRKKEAQLPRIRVRRETELHGREADLEALSEAWEEARNGEGNTVFVEGEAGIGKTRLIDAFLRGLPDRDFHVLYGSYPPSGGLGGISDAILGKFGEIDLAGVLAPYLTVTPNLVPAFAALVRHESAPTGAEPLAGDALNAVCVHLMRALAGEKPLVWIIDDLQFAPKESRDTVLSLARAVEGHRVLVVTAARPGVPEDELAHFSRLPNHRRLSLARLGGREIVELLEDAFGSEALAEKLGGKIAKKSDGVPFFVFEMIRGLAEGQFIKRQPDGSFIQTKAVDDIEVPSAVKDLIEGRLRGLTEEQRAVLDVGAVQGMEFDPALVAAVVEEKRVRVLRDLAQVERRHGLVRGEAGLTHFDQNQIQEVIYADLTPDLRTEYHTLLAEAHADRLQGEPTGRDAVFLATHHLRGSRPEAGLPHLTSALDHLEESYRNEAAIDLSVRALAKPGLLEGKERVEVLLRKAGRHDLRGEREAERADLDEAVALADGCDDTALRARARGALGWQLFQTSDYAAGQERLEQARDLAREAGEKRVEGHVTGSLGNILWSLGCYEEAREHHERGLALAREIGDRPGEARSSGGLGNVLWSLGRFEEARAHLERSHGLAREIGIRQGEAAAVGSLGVLALVLGRLEEARARIEEHLVLAREIGDRRGEAVATGNLGNVLWSLGLSGESLKHHERQLAVTREIADRQGEVNAAGNLGLVLGDLGRSEEALAHHERQLALAREIGDRRQEGYALCSLASLAERRWDLDDALRILRDCLALRRELGDQDGVVEALVAMARIEAAKGETESARNGLSEALTLARETETPDMILAVTVEQARLPGGDVDAAREAFDEHAERVPHAERMEARFRLWELTGDETHLTEAHRMLRHARDHAPEDCRDSMIENVPVHREIMAAWDAAETL